MPSEYETNEEKDQLRKMLRPAILQSAERMQRRCARVALEFGRQDIADAIMAPSAELEEYREQQGRIPPRLRDHHSLLCSCASGMARQLAFGSLMLAEGKKAVAELIAGIKLL